MEKGCKEARKAKATIVFADESAIQMAPNVKRTWSPRGQTPIMKQTTRSYRKISAMGAVTITPLGRKSRIFFRLLKAKNFNTTSCIAFIEQLKINIRGQIRLVWDRLVAHRSKKMMKYLEKQSRVKVVLLPPYAPELNPAEYLWAYLKGNELSNKPHFDLEHLFESAKISLCKIRGQKNLVKGFVQHSRLSKAIGL
jgi:transposase